MLNGKYFIMIPVYMDNIPGIPVILPAQHLVNGPVVINRIHLFPIGIDKLTFFFI
jgi:hypothetical protein